MNHFCENCEYLKDYPDLIDSCVHKKFCERTYSEGLKSSGILTDVEKVSLNEKVLYVFEIFKNYPVDTQRRYAETISNYFKPSNCLFIPQDFGHLIRENIVALELTNKFHYREGSYILTANDGTTFTEGVKDAISELLGKPVAAFNKFQVFIRKVEEDYRHAEDTGVSEE